MIANGLTPTRNVHVTPSDSAELDAGCMGIRANAIGTLVLEGSDGITATYNVVAGEVIVGKWRRVLATGTSLGVANLVAFLK